MARVLGIHPAETIGKARSRGRLHGPFLFAALSQFRPYRPIRLRIPAPSSTLCRDHHTTEPALPEVKPVSFPPLNTRAHRRWIHCRAEPRFILRRRFETEQAYPRGVAAGHPPEHGVAQMGKWFPIARKLAKGAARGRRSRLTGDLQNQAPGQTQTGSQVRQLAKITQLRQRYGPLPFKIEATVKNRRTIGTVWFSVDMRIPWFEARVR